MRETIEWALSLIAAVAMFSLWSYGQLQIAAWVGFDDAAILAAWCIVSFIAILAIAGRITDGKSRQL